MLKEYPKFKKGQAEKVYNRLSKAQKEELKMLLLYREGRGLKGYRLKDLRRVLIQIYYVLGGTIKEKVSNETEATELSLVIKNSHFSTENKINILINFGNLIKKVHRDWSIKFDGFEMFSVKEFKKGDCSEPKEYDLLTDEEIKKIFRAEPKLFWKCFFKIGEQTGLRTKENRLIKNKKIEFNEDGTATIEIYMTKVGKKKFVFVDSETTNLIKRLQEEQKNTDTYGEFLFPSPKKVNEAISKNQVCSWFRNLSLRALGRKCIFYQLRHLRANILYKLAKENKISKDTAISLMGHSEDLSSRYTHINEDERKKILKEQAFKLELPEEKKHKLEIEIAENKKLISALQEQMGIFERKIIYSIKNFKKRENKREEILKEKKEFEKLRGIKK